MTNFNWRELLVRLRRAEGGQDLIEYALLATVVSLASIAGIAVLQSALAAVFSAIALQLQ
jgi:Flp pilus assembly pilin Flp